MGTTAATSLVERQVEGFNSGSIEDVVGVYADDATFVMVSPHTLPGSELRLEGREKIERHMQRVLKGGIGDVKVEWIDGGEGFLAWRDTGFFGTDTRFSESHTARLDDEGRIVEHWIHSVYAKG